MGSTEMEGSTGNGSAAYLQGKIDMNTLDLLISQIMNLIFDLHEMGSGCSQLKNDGDLLEYRGFAGSVTLDLASMQMQIWRDGRLVYDNRAPEALELVAAKKAAMGLVDEMLARYASLLS